MIDLHAAGLTATEANCYQALLTHTSIKPSELAEIVHETRTNCYKILDKLVGYKLAERVTTEKVLHYRAANPTQLLQLARKRRAEQEQAEQELEVHVKSLLRSYSTTHEQPGIRYFEGEKEITEIYADQVKSGQPICFMHTIAGIDFYGYQRMHDLRMMAVNAKIPRWAITPDTKLAHANYRETDKKFLLHRTWLKEIDYTAPVEWGTYGNKMYIISFGKEAMGLTIESNEIANAFRQVFALIERGQRLLPDYASLPKLAQKEATV